MRRYRRAIVETGKRFGVTIEFEDISKVRVLGHALVATASHRLRPASFSSTGLRSFAWHLSHLTLMPCGAHSSQAKAAGNANNDWKLSHRLVVELWDRGGNDSSNDGSNDSSNDSSSSRGPPPEYEAVKDVFEEIYQGGLWKTEALIIDRSLLQRLQDAGVSMVSRVCAPAGCGGLPGE